MMLEEFEKRTGYFPTMEEYAAIEKAYMEFSGDKDAFCKAYKKNEDGIAERIQREVNMQHINVQREAEKAQKAMEERIAELEKALEREQEWRPYEDTDNVQQADYEMPVPPFSACTAAGYRCKARSSCSRSRSGYSSSRSHCRAGSGQARRLFSLGMDGTDTYITRHEVDDLFTIVHIDKEAVPWQQ